jgi:hypothetical protein
VFENERPIRRTDDFNLPDETRRDLAARLVGDDGHAFMRLDIQTDADGILRAGLKFAIDGQFRVPLAFR